MLVTRINVRNIVQFTSAIRTPYLLFIVSQILSLFESMKNDHKFWNSWYIYRIGRGYSFSPAPSRWRCKSTQGYWVIHQRWLLSKLCFCSNTALYGLYATFSPIHHETPRRPKNRQHRNTIKLIHTTHHMFRVNVTCFFLSKAGSGYCLKTILLCDSCYTEP